MQSTASAFDIDDWFAPDPPKVRLLPVAENPATEFIARYRSDPSSFVTNLFGVRPDPWQDIVLRAVARGETRISIRSGNGVGKTALLAWLMVWFILTRYPVKIVCTAPTSAQLFDALFVEVQSWINRLPEAVRSLLAVTTDRIELKSDAASAFISARTSRPETPEALQGVHAAYVLLIVDEASGVDERVYSAGQTSMSTPGAITVLASNPLRSAGFFYRTHTDWADRWMTMRVSGLDSPRVDPKFIQEVKDNHGESSIEYQVKVLGEFPSSDTDTYFSKGMVQGAMSRSITPDAAWQTAWGLDVARFGTDRSVLFKRTARHQVEAYKVWRNVDLMTLCGFIKHDYDSLAPSHRPFEILIDSIGLGAGVVDRLRELELPAFGINVAETPSSVGAFGRLRDELYFNARQWLESREVALLPDDAFAHELQSIKYGFTSTGKLKIESKDEMRKRMKASPDIVDAFCLTFGGTALAASGQLIRFPMNKPIVQDNGWVV
jgi:phage terminase large subunit